MRALLAVPSFPRLLSAWTIGNFADSALFLTLAVWAKDLSGSSGAAGLVFLCLGAPVLAGPLFGLVADRVRRRPLLVASNLVAAVAVLGLLAVDQPSDLGILYAVTVVYGALGSINGAAQSGLLRTMLPDSLLAPANALFMTIDQGLRIVTPLAGAGLYAAFGGPALAIAVSVMLLITALALLSVRVVEPRPERDAGDLDDQGLRALVAGFRHVRKVPVLRRTVVGLGISLGVIGMFDSVLFAAVEHGLGKEPAFFGVLMSAQGAGSILGGVLAVRALGLLGPIRAVGAGLVVFAVSGALCVVPAVPAVLIGSFLAGSAIPVAFVALATTRQKLTPNHLQGRVASATSMALQIPQLVAIAVGAALVDAVDYRILTAVAVVVITGAALWLWSKHEPSSTTAATDEELAHQSAGNLAPVNPS